MKIDKFFDDAARARVAEAVKAAEAQTSGQIVPVVVERSGGYRALVISWVLLVAFGVALGWREIGVFFHLHLTPLTIFNLAAGSAVGGALFLTVPAFWRAMLSREFEAAARKRAMLAFVEHGVNRTREQNGVLLFASLYERKVVVLGDRAVHEKLGDQHWKRAVDTLVTGIKSGDPAEGFCKAIADIGEEMAKAFPRGSAPQSNEISDELRVDR
jgi:putative membrane protein